MNPSYYKETNFEIFTKILFYFSLFNISFFYITRLYDLSRKYLILYLVLSSILIFAFRSNSKVNSVILNRPTKLNYVIIREKNTSSKEIQKVINVLRNIELVKSVNFSQKIPLDQITKLETTENIDFYIIQNERNISKSQFEKLIQFNKPLVLLNEKISNINDYKSITKKVFIKETMIYEINPNSQSGIQLLLKRLIDLVLSVTLLVVLFPLIVFLAAFVFSIDYKKPIISLPRTGKNSRLFHMYKIRTMKVDSHKLRNRLNKLNYRNGPLFKIENDPRILKNTNWIRRFSLDEIPQLVNVIKGEMSLVGPRPLFKEDLKKYRSNEFIRQSVLPGLTGLLQIRDRETQDFDVWNRHDQEYISRWSLFLDIKIILITPIRVLFLKSK